MPSFPPNTFVERVAFHVRSDDEFRTATDAFMLSFALVATVSALSGSFVLGVGSAPLALLLSFVYSKTRVHVVNKHILLPAAFLGAAVGVNVWYTVWAGSGRLAAHLTRYFTFLFLFHYSEFVFTALTNRRSLRPDSFLLNHSVGYWLAAAVSWIEFIVEAYYLPGLKSSTVMWIGTIGCVIGEICRKMAMVHAGLGFTHRLAMTKRSDHRLVKDGIYALMRHPGYFGWFVWAVSTQLILCNPVCFLVYTYLTWHFFASRIYDEEKDLIAFFGDSYLEYQQNVWVGVPFVAGYRKP